jgi:hemolysin III
MAWARAYSEGERRADLAVHLVGIAFAVAAGPALMLLAARAHVPTVMAAAALYVASLVAMILASAAYNLAPSPPRISRLRHEALRRLDHGMIFLKIAGTYTPFAAISMGKGSGPALLAVVWTVALIGAAVKFAAPRRFELVSVALYLSLGWSFLWVVQEASSAIQMPALILLGTGGVLYSVGVLFHLWGRLPYQNAIWHLHVLVATICMYAAVVVEIGRPPLARQLVSIFGGSTC